MTFGANIIDDIIVGIAIIANRLSIRFTTISIDTTDASIRLRI